MKICHITSAHAHTSSRIFNKECQTLSQNEFDTYLVAPNAPDIIDRGVKIRGVNVTSGKRISRMTNTVKAIYKKAIEVNADVYHFHDPELLFVGYLLKRKGKRVIYDVHEDVPVQILYKQWLPRFLRKVISSVFKGIENTLSKKFDGIVTATPLINNRFKALGCETENINNYPILAEFGNNLTTQGRNKENVVCYVGGINYVRGIKEMVNSLQFADTGLLLAGHFMDGCNRDFITTLNGWEKVEELGFVDRVEVQKVMRKSIAGLVVLHPIRNYIDSLPVKMFEYMSSGLPVIASDFPLWQKIIGDAKCGICVDPLSPRKIGEAVQWIKNNPKKAEVMGQNGKNAVIEKYNWEQEGKKLVSFYNTLKYK